MPVYGQLTFEDLFLNPSVTVRDELRLKWQAWLIYQLFFKRPGEVSNLQMQEIAMQYNARLFEIREALAREKTGKTIKLIRRCKRGLNFYALVNVE